MRHSNAWSSPLNRSGVVSISAAYACSDLDRVSMRLGPLDHETIEGARSVAAICAGF